MESVRRKLLKNPRNTASKVSALLFLWTIEIFRKGYQRTLELTDLYETLPEDRSCNLGDRLERNWNKRRKCKKNQPSLIKAIAATFWKNYLFLGMICVLNDVIIRLSQPYLLGRLLIYFQKDSSMRFNDALWYAIAIITLNAMNMMAVNQYFIGCFHAGMKMRISVCSVIYRKVLKLSQTARGKIAVVNLLSNDVNRFDLVSFLIHSMWSAPLMSCIVAYLLWLEARWAGIIGIVVVFLVVPIQSYTGKLSSIFRLKAARRTDERIKFMDEIITGVRIAVIFFTGIISLTHSYYLNYERDFGFPVSTNRFDISYDQNFGFPASAPLTGRFVGEGDYVHGHNAVFGWLNYLPQMLPYVCHVLAPHLNRRDYYENGGYISYARSHFPTKKVLQSTIGDGIWPGIGK